MQENTSLKETIDARLKTIYLCGGINNCTDSECRDWREQVKSALSGRYLFLDPMRRDYRGRESEFVKELVEADYEDIRSADIILVWAPVPSWGTAMEVHQAFAIDRKYVVAICPNPRVSPWLQYHTHKRLPSIESALEWLSKLDEEILPSDGRHEIVNCGERFNNDRGSTCTGSCKCEK